MEEPPGRLLAKLGRAVEQTAREIAREEVDEHERHCHTIPPADRSPITAVPFADILVTDDEASHAIELLQDMDESQVAEQMGIPLPALQRKLADYQRRHGVFLRTRATLG